MLWMREKGMRLCRSGPPGLQINGMFKFWGGLTVEAWGGGPGLVEGWTRIAAKNRSQSPMARGRCRCCQTTNGVKGVKVKHDGKTSTCTPNAWCWRPRFPGQYRNAHCDISGRPGNWQKSAAPASTPATASRWRSTSGDATGNWSGGHAVGWIAMRRSSAISPSAIIFRSTAILGHHDQCQWRALRRRGRDFRNYTYAKYGRVILMQPGQFAGQVFDSKIIPMLRDEYRIKRVTKCAPIRSRNWSRSSTDGHRRQGARDDSDLQQGRDDRGPFDPNVKGRPRHQGPSRCPKFELGQHGGPGAVRGLAR